MVTVYVVPLCLYRGYIAGLCGICFLCVDIPHTQQVHTLSFDRLVTETTIGLRITCTHRRCFISIKLSIPITTRRLLGCHLSPRSSYITAILVWSAWTPPQIDRQRTHRELASFPHRRPAVPPSAGVHVGYRAEGHQNWITMDGSDCSRG